MHKLTIFDDGDYDYVGYEREDGKTVYLLIPVAGEIDVHAYNQNLLGGTRAEAKHTLYTLLWGDIDFIREEKVIVQ